MGLSEEYRKKIKESLDTDNGGRLRAIANKAKAVNAPVLIIGLGGTGMSALRVTKKLIYDTIESERKPNGELSDKPKNIEYLGIDTDEAEKRKGFQGMYLNENNGELKIYTMPDVQGVLAHPELLPPYVSSWVNTNINTKSVIDGAGAVRQLGRLLLMMNLGELQTVIKNKIDKVTAGYPADTPLYVFILSGISGGTGSGTFIDVPYLVKANVTGGRPSRNIGILFMPDVNARRSGINNVKRESLYANGYAALKELDYLMKIEEVGDSFEQTYGNIRVGLAGESPIPPYDICLLMSSKNRDGATIGTGDDCYNEIVHIAAETVFNFSLGDDGAKDHNGFSINSFLANETNNINTYITQLGNLRHPVTYVYSIAGASSAKLPLDDIMSYLTYKAFQEVEKYWNQRPEEKDIDTVLNYFKLNRKEMENLAATKAGKADTSRIKFEDAKNNPARVVQLYENAFIKQQNAFSNNIQLMAENLEKMVADKNNLINQYFMDLQRGPIFAQQCLYSPGGRSVITDLRKISTDLSTDMVTAQQLELLEGTANEKLKKLKDGGLIFSRRNALAEYLDAMDKLYNAKRKNALHAQLMDYCSAASSIILEKNNSIYELVAELMETLVTIFEKYGNIKTNTQETKGASGTTLSWAIVDTPAFIRELERRMEQMPELAVDLHGVVAGFYEYLFENTELWSGARRDDVVENINNFIYDKFKQVLDHSMDFFLSIIANSQNMTLQEYCTGIIKELKQKAEVRFPIDRAYAAGAVSQPGYSFISVPNNSPQLFAAAQQIAANSVSGGGAGSIVKQSGIRDRIFMMNFMSATPLSLYSELKDFYERYKAHKNDPGLHLYEACDYSIKAGKAQDWKRLPSPYPETEWVAFNDPVESQINAEYREVLRKALKYGYVTTDPQTQTMTCRTGKPVNWQLPLSENKIKYPDTNSIPSQKGKKAIRQIKTELKDLETRCPSVTVRTRMVTDDTHTALKQSYMEMMFIQMFKVRDEVKRMVENHEECLAVLEDLRARTVDDSVMENYVLCRLFDLVKKNKSSLTDYVYQDSRGASQKLASLTGKQTSYVEYYLMDAYIGLDEKTRTKLDANAQDALKHIEDLEAVRRRWDVYQQKQIDRPLEVLNDDWEDIDDGEKLLASYQIMKDAVTNVGNLFGTNGDDEDEF